MSEIIRVECPPLGEYSLLSSPIDWVGKTNVEDYARRQAQSCEYLENLFPIIKRRSGLHPEINFEELLSPLLDVHRRQFRQLTTALPSYLSENRDSFYFNYMYEAQGLGHPLVERLLSYEELFKLLLVHGFSYIRGADRYNLLKDYQDPSNDPYRSIWEDFYQDASGNWIKTWEFIEKNFDLTNARQLIEHTTISESNLMQQIWNYKGINGNRS